MKAAELRQIKREEAEKRNAAWQALSFEQQLEQLDKLFGKGKGATKQRAKIALKIAQRDLDQVTGKAKSKAKKAKK